jgi:hypothetical protein
MLLTMRVLEASSIEPADELTAGVARMSQRADARAPPDDRLRDIRGF